MSIQTCSIVGAGVAARALAPAMVDAGIEIAGVSGGREPQRTSALAADLGVPVFDIGDTAMDVDLVVLAVADRALKEVVAALPAPTPPEPIVVHMAGALRPDVLAPFSRRAKLHPIASLAGGSSRLQGVAWGVECDDDERPALYELVDRLDGIPLDTAGVDLARYHLAAVYASNFILAVLDQARRLWEESGAPLPAEEALLPLVRTAVNNWEGADLEHALTGPIARGDLETVVRQLRLIADDGPAALNLYRALALATADLAARTGRNASQIAEICRSLIEDTVLD